MVYIWKQSFSVTLAIALNKTRFLEFTAKTVKT